MDITTNTIADLYIKQGYLDKALDIYKTILEIEPDNEEAKQMVAELEAKIAAESVVEGESIVSEAVSAETGAVAAVIESTVPSGMAEGNSLEAQISRLENWLNSIREIRAKR